MSRWHALREECLAANKSLPATGLVNLTFGNVSVCDRAAQVFAIKPSGVPYEQLDASDIVVLNLDGAVVEGHRIPSTDTPTHRRLYLGFEDMRAVVHTHSRCAVAFAQAGREIPILGTTHADYFRGPVPVTRELTEAEIASHYEWQTGNVIVETFAKLAPREIPAVLVRNHGPFAWANSGHAAVEIAQALETVADIALRSLSLDPATTPLPAALRDRHFLRKHGAGATYGQH